ncbi:aspartate/glutamate racemase family protein [Salicibibacter kimchii]|uniref:Asp/Glu/hydantoin racemase n=1 Tax=Salicibibacter kimchii TaxID=2099786 RepID=A0A345C2V8_9BACI|nr:aspartate/glutamate racemase family protein [Salicibibacter kimchii]AXF57539.1 Asp/Glu/hydantoin racemase [Salicibibacter kimchii]
MSDNIRIGLIHATMNSVSPILRAFSQLEEKADLVNFMDEGLIYELNETNTVTNRMIMRLSELAGKAVESNVDAILFTCSSFTPYVAKIAELIPVPVLSSDMSMLEKAVEKSSDIVVIATVKAAGPTTERMLNEAAAKRNKKVNIKMFVLREAFQALQNGEPSAHDQLIQEKIQEHEGAETIVLAQYSMARAVESTNFPNVLTGPHVSAQSIMRKAREAEYENR